MNRINDNEDHHDDAFTLRNINMSFGNKHKRNESDGSNNEYISEYDKMIRMKETNM